MREVQPSEQALAALMDALGDAPLSATARAVLESRYLRRDRRGEVCETPVELFERVARHVSGAEPPQEREEVRRIFSALMRSGLFLPNSPTLMNAGLCGGQLAACFVLPVGDSIEEIFEAVKSMALVQKTGGGTGFSFSRLRPGGDPVSTTGGTASGPVTFLEVFNAASDSIRQGGRRRGASMGVLEVHHPDILDFIKAKRDPRRLTNFNLSVGLTEEFMAALEAGRPYALRFPCGEEGETRSELEAAGVFGLLAHSAWQTGEPGVLFLDRMEADNPTPELGRLETTNPCGELPLLPYESCNLGSVNLAAFATGGAVDWPALAAAVRWGVRMLDDVIDTTSFPLTRIAEATARTRKIGLGVMGFADLLIELEIPYDSPRALEVAEEVMSFVHRTSREASEELARRRGPFPAYEGSRSAARGEPPRRNATTNTVAPTGTISILAGCSPGIEPIFAPVFSRRLLDGQEVVEVHPLLGARLREQPKGPLSQDLLERMAEAGHARIAGAPERLARLFVTAHQVNPSHHVKIQAAFQRHTDNSVSKTVNLPTKSTPEEVEEIFRLAYEQGCKGITVYRDGSRDAQVLSTSLPQKHRGDLLILDSGPQVR